MSEIRADLTKIMINETSEEQVIVLKERDGERSFPIIIGFYEAAAIDRKIKDQQVQRPLTHDLLGSVINAMDANLDKVVVNDLKHNTFYARLVFSRPDGQVVEVDARPSDAIALAVRMESPIYVEEKVLEVISGQM